MKFSKCYLFLIVCFITASATAQKDYDKPLNKWGKEESLKIVSESSWAKTYQAPASSAGASAGQVAREQSQNAGSGGSNPRSVARYFGPPPVVIRLHSAEVIRKATVRLQQIDAGYDKMSEGDRVKFDAGRKVFLECAICKDYYVVTLTKFREVNSQTVDEGIFQSMAFADLKGKVWLANDRGERRELVQFTAPNGSGDSTIFFFKRTNEKGESLITSESKELRFVFDNTFLDARNRFAYLLPRSFDFRASKLIVGEKVMF